MTVAAEERIAWHPETPEEKAEVRVALAAILATPYFCNSKRYPAFLEYVVNAVLSGHGDELKERTIGIEVFGRRPDYDTNSDTVVRYTAGEVRKRLALYYSETGHPTAIRIYLPVGSYVPELVLVPRTAMELSGERIVLSHAAAPEDLVLREPDEPHAPTRSELSDVLRVASDALTSAPPPKRSNPARTMFVAAAAVLFVLFASLYARHRFAIASGASGKDGDAILNQFWNSTLVAPGTKLICSGSVVFSPNHFSGVTTATKDADYSFLSVQIAQSIAHLSGYMERHNATYTVQTSAATPLTELRERPVILLGGYNNDWSMRLLEPLRFHFSLNHSEPAIVDAQQPSKTWARDFNRDYGNQDDYAIVARFTDSTTDGPVVVLAGLGRNGTEAATEFVTSPEFLKEYTNQHPLSKSANVEFVLHSRVVDGKTGAPSVVAAYTW